MNAFETDVVDLTYLYSITRGDKAMIANFVQMFYAEHHKVLSALTQAYQQDNLPELAKAAHKLKASVKAMGAHRLYHAVVHIEELANTAVVEHEDLEEAYVQVQLENDRFEEALEQKLA